MSRSTGPTETAPGALAAAQHVKPADGRPLTIWTIYRSPKDLPGVEFMARKWEIRAGVPDPVATDQTITASLTELRTRFFAAGLHRLDRSEGDDPVIVECWL